MKKLRIIIDSDEVLVYTVDAVIERYNAEYAQSLTKEEIVSWDLNLYKKPGSSITKYFGENGFFRHLKMVEGAGECLEKLLEDGHEILIATAVPILGIVDKVYNMLTLFPQLEEEQIVPISKKYFLKADVILDDGLHNLESTLCEYPFVFDRPWNRNIPVEMNNAGKIKRIKTWNEFYEQVSLLSKEG